MQNRAASGRATSSSWAGPGSPRAAAGMSRAQRRGQRWSCWESGWEGERGLQTQGALGGVAAGEGASCESKPFPGGRGSGGGSPRLFVDQETRLREVLGLRNKACGG